MLISSFKGDDVTPTGGWATEKASAQNGTVKVLSLPLVSEQKTRKMPVELIQCNAVSTLMVRAPHSHRDSLWDTTQKTEFLNDLEQVTSPHQNTLPWIPLCVSLVRMYISIIYTLVYLGQIFQIHWQHLAFNYFPSWQLPLSARNTNILTPYFTDTSIPLPLLVFFLQHALLPRSLLQHKLCCHFCSRDVWKGSLAYPKIFQGQQESPVSTTPHTPMVLLGSKEEIGKEISF